MFRLQQKVFPFSIINDNTGMLWYHSIGVPHFGHLDPGKTIDSSLGSLCMITFKKLPNIKPKTAIRKKIILF